MKWFRYWLLAYAFLVALRHAVAHDAERPDLDPWFDKLKSSRGLCCSFVDGSVVKDVDWESKNGRYRVLVWGKWLDVPDDAVIKEPNLDGRTIVWPVRLGDEIYIRCFMPGTMT
jgi:hypothetical protein